MKKKKYTEQEVNDIVANALEAQEKENRRQAELDDIKAALDKLEKRVLKLEKKKSKIGFSIEDDEN